MHNIFNKIITENCPKLEEDLPIQVKEAFRTPNRLYQHRSFPWHIVIKTTSTENRERILKAVIEINQIKDKGQPQKNSRFLNRNLKRKRA
jgi:hypothetical protein